MKKTAAAYSTNVDKIMTLKTAFLSSFCTMSTCLFEPEFLVTYYLTSLDKIMLNIVDSF